ncbi:MAG: T9SS type A sorting domain-containing protein, partial [bacterium]
KYDIGEPYQLAAEDGQTANLYATWGPGNHSSVAKVPFRVWDTEFDPPRQLSVVVRDRDQNGQWDLHKQYAEDDPNFVDINNGDFRYNYIFILDSDYDETGNNWNPNAGGRDFMAEILVDGGPVMWALWNVQRGSREPLGADFTLTMIAPNINLPTDIFSFTSAGPVFRKSTAEEDLREMVNVFPNPYLGFNSRELNRFDRFVTFSHLPQKAVIRIFNLAGALVKTIEKDDPSQFINWNLQNDNELPVASGIYIVHMEFPDFGMTKDLKLAIVMEQQFLRNF